ncbi:MAG: acetoacetate--CoA ligase, partial [Luteibacter jiangsuensis]
DETRELIGLLPTLEAVVTVDNLGLDPVDDAGVPTLPFAGAVTGDSPAEAVPLPFDHPLWVLFTSGTTGAPKGIVHGHGGVVLEHLELLGLQDDMTASDVFFWYTTCNWMMWNLLVSALLVGAAIVVYDGSPVSPDADRLWQIVEKHRVTVFGTSPGHLLASEKAGLRPGTEHDLSVLRSIGSTGAPLPVSGFHWVMDAVGPQIQIGSVSGGTDLVGAFVGPASTVPVWAGEISCVNLGVALEAWDENGKPVVGEVGELVVTKPIPSMPVFFWNDPDGEKYRSAYFARVPGVWCHGDHALLTEHDGVVIYGRSDATLNPGGVRIGTAEIYRQVEQVPEVLESVAVGQHWGDDERVILFVRLREGIALDDALRDRIVRQIRANTTPRHVPAKIVQVADIPRTISGKITEIAVRDVIHGRPVKNTDALANPQALECFRNLEALRQ